MSALPTYEYYKAIFRGRQMPLAFVDLELFDKNTRDVVKRAGGKKIRVASKSVRCAALLKRITGSDPVYRGLMCYSPLEACYLSEQGFDDLFVAYPAFNEADISAVCAKLKAGKQIALMCDCAEHVEQLDRIGKKQGCVIPVCFDLDMSSDYPGLHFGVRRSPLKTPAQAVELFKRMKGLSNVRLEGLMGYEAQIAGLGDAGSSPMKMLIRFLKKRSKAEVFKRREEAVTALRAEGAKLRFVNGGGTGSVEATSAQDCVTEVTAGSAFYSPTLFDNFLQFRHMPAAGYAIEITRKPAPNIYTCYGGGYTASGQAGPDKLPKPYLPEGAVLLGIEGAGEVQTPVQYEGSVKLSIGDPVLMRHAKAGELCERFNTILLVSGGKVVDEVKTYRGDGRSFL
jgi:D-serine deaminase-like pyridoxal phosphate-dependent protein